MFADKPKILMLVEGAKMEIKLMEHLLSVYGISQSHQIVSYNTSIYDLYAHMFVDTDPDDVDLLQLLKERETDPAKRNCLTIAILIFCLCLTLIRRILAFLWKDYTDGFLFH